MPKLIIPSQKKPQIKYKSPKKKIDAPALKENMRMNKTLRGIRR